MEKPSPRGLQEGLSRKDPEVRYLDSNGQNGQGTKVATFTLATTERYRDRSGELRENTEWHNIVAWRNIADIAEKYIRKGSQLYIEGRLRTRSYTDQQGMKKYTTEITVDNLQLLGRREGEPSQQGGFQQQGTYQQRGSYQQPAPQPQAAPAYNQAPSYAGATPQQTRPAQQQPLPAVPAMEIEDAGDDLPF